MNVLIASLAPVIIILFYVYFRDKYEKEPIGLLILALFAGALTVIPIIIVERFIGSLNPFANTVGSGAYNAFLVAGLVEEAFKLLALYLVVWRDPNFNEKFDGIVYAVFISLGFAAVENVLYVSGGGIEVAKIRAFTAVPAHALFGIMMGYYFGIAHMYPELKKKYLKLAFIIPFLLHGIYDFILMAELNWLLITFIPYLVYLYFQGFRRMKQISDMSIFREDIDLE